MKRRWKKIWLWTGSAALFLVLVAGGCVWYLYHSVEQVADRIYEKTDKPVYISKDPEVQQLQQQSQPQPVASKKTLSANPIKENKAFNVLLLGVDQRINDRGRSDTIIVLSVNPDKKSIVMFNIPRDTRVPIAGHNTIDKINHAYAFGGVDMSIRTVEAFIDYPIDYYMKVNMGGFQKIIDLIGGVEVNNPFAFTDGGHEFKKGLLKLDGKQALSYSRMRYEDPRGDLGRNARQREILQQAMKQALNLDNLPKMKGLLDEVGQNVKTDITFSELKTFVKDYRPDIEEITNSEIKGKGATIGGIWYYLVDDEERARIHNLIKNQLGGGSGTTVAAGKS